MIKKINKTKEILSRLEKREINWSKEDQEKFHDMLKKLKEDSIIKQNESNSRASNVWLD